MNRTQYKDSDNKTIYGGDIVAYRYQMFECGDIEDHVGVVLYDPVEKDWAIGSRETGQVFCHLSSPCLLEVRIAIRSYVE